MNILHEWQQNLDLYMKDQPGKNAWPYSIEQTEIEKMVMFEEQNYKVNRLARVIKIQRKISSACIFS